MRLFSPVNMRQSLATNNEAIGVFIAAITNDVPLSDNELWSSASAFAELLRAERTPARLLQSIDGLARVMSTRPAVAQVAALLHSHLNWDILLSNLGVLPIPNRYGPVKLKEIWGPIVSLGFAEEQVVGVATLGSTLRLVHTSYSPIDGLLAEAARLLSG
ncbi:hypothetical protein [Caballeronia sordidicola]|nr:hypothetical protein [Caballeronia sordidicola]